MTNANARMRESGLSESLIKPGENIHQEIIIMDAWEISEKTFANQLISMLEICCQLPELSQGASHCWGRGAAQFLFAQFKPAR